MTTITTNYSTIAAVKLFAAEDDIRAYLNNVLLEVCADHAVLVAADGHSAAAARVPVEGHGGVIAQYIIPMDALAGLRKPKRGEVDAVTIRVRLGESKALPRIEIEQNGAVWSCFAMDARYPDWRLVWPKKCSGEVAYYTPELSARVHKAVLLITGYGYVAIAQNGTSPGMRNINDTFSVIVMPMRHDTGGDTELLAWISGPFTAPVAVEAPAQAVEVAA